MVQRFGAFGKMPAAGDFFRLNPPTGFVSVWDGWLQQAMLDAQAALGAAWDAHYMSAPIWRFTLAPGLAGAQKALGVLMPSVDRVGRRFPLTLMTALPGAGPALADHFRAEAVFAQLEEVALAALDDGMTRDRLEERLTAIVPPDAATPARLGRSGRCLTLAGGGPATLAADLAAGLLAGQHRTPSIWSAEVGGGPRLMICEGLPAGPQARALYDLTAQLWEGAA